MPVWEKLKSMTVMTPVAPGENILYPWESGPVALNKPTDAGHTALTYLVKRHPDEWENFLNRMHREGRINPVDLAVLTTKIKYGQPVKITDADLILALREWGSLRVQPYFRTLNGKMHYVPILQLYARINHPEWDEARVKLEANKNLP